MKFNRFIQETFLPSQILRFGPLLVPNLDSIQAVIKNYNRQVPIIILNDVKTIKYFYNGTCYKLQIFIFLLSIKKKLF